MTSEVAILNRYAVALAADSAITLVQSIGGASREKYLKTGNKLFNLSRRRPVGLMIYHAASINAVPWEIVIKEYRDNLGDGSFRSLKEYAEHFLEFVKGHRGYFPDELRRRHLISSALEAVARVYLAVCRDHKHREADEARDEIDALFKQYASQIDADEYVGDCGDEDVVRLAELIGADVATGAAKDPGLADFSQFLAAEKVIPVALKLLFKKKYTVWQPTGLAFAGFGEGDYFPKLHVYEAYALTKEKLIISHIEDKEITPDNVSEIVPLASATMIRTFIYGMSEDVLAHVTESIRSAMLQLESERLGPPKDEAELEDRQKLREKIASEAETSLGRHILAEHRRPLMRTIGSLSIDELARLAETLIGIEALKESVTQWSESVSGPIDVAVISRSDGFIWIKRKHYFDPKLNPRFFDPERLLGAQSKSANPRRGS